MDEIVTEKDALRNLDSHEAHGNLWRGSSPCDVIPSSEECEAILTERLSVSKEVVAHSKKVAQVALYLTNALNEAGCDLNAHLVVAACLLHDLAKGSRNHASVAERLLRGMNFNTVAGIVGAHMSVEVLEKDQSISEREVVWLTILFREIRSWALQKGIVKSSMSGRTTLAHVRQSQADWPGL